MSHTYRVIHIFGATEPGSNFRCICAVWTRVFRFTIFKNLFSYNKIKFLRLANLRKFSNIKKIYWSKILNLITFLKALKSLRWDSKYLSSSELEILTIRIYYLLILLSYFKSQTLNKNQNHYKIIGIIILYILTK